MLDGRFDPALFRLLTGQDAPPVAVARDTTARRLPFMHWLLSRPTERSAE